MKIGNESLRKEQRHFRRTWKHIKQVREGLGSFPNRKLLFLKCEVRTVVSGLLFSQKSSPSSFGPLWLPLATACQCAFHSVVAAEKLQNLPDWERAQESNEEECELLFLRNMKTE